MKQPPDQCAHVQDGKQCQRRAWKAGERFCITHDIQIVLARGAFHDIRETLKQPIQKRGADSPVLSKIQRNQR